MQKKMGYMQALHLARRLLAERADEFIFEEFPASGHDVFEIESMRDKVVIRGTSPAVQASGLNHYLKHYCQAHISWEGHQLDLPRPLPAAPKIRIASPYRSRCYFASGYYSVVWWDWARWEKEIDWMALQGFNTHLVPWTGQEAVEQLVWRELGLRDEDLKDYWCGPAYTPFFAVGYVNGIGGPLPQTWIDGQKELMKKIVDRERALGIKSILRAFAGNIPRALQAKFPEAAVHKANAWCCEISVGQSPAPVNLWLDPADPLFTRISRLFLEAQTSLYGTDHFYYGNPFIESLPLFSEPAYLSRLTRGISDSMRAGDAEAIWFIDSWGFHYWKGKKGPDGKIWGDAQIRSFLAGVPDDRMVILDWLHIWKTQAAFQGKEWLWGVTHNLGGATGMYGDLPFLAQAPAPALRDPGRGRLGGMVICPEGNEENAVYYELFAEMQWRQAPIDLDRWIVDYSRRRYGVQDERIEAAWRLLVRTVYHNTTIGTPPGLCQRPRLSRKYGNDGNIMRPTVYRQFDPFELVEAGRLFLAGADKLGHSDLYRYDLVEVIRQVLRASLDYTSLNIGDAGLKRDRDALKQAGDTFLEGFSLMDALLATRREFLLGPWLAKARHWGANSKEQDLCEWNARMLITIWCEERIVVNDYAGKEWSGLIKDYYLPRWQMFLDAVQQALAENRGFDQKEYDARIAPWEIAWVRQKNEFPVEPSGDEIVQARKAWEFIGKVEIW